MPTRETIYSLHAVHERALNPGGDVARPGAPRWLQDGTLLLCGAQPPSAIASDFLAALAAVLGEMAQPST